MALHRSMLLFLFSTLSAATLTICHLTPTGFDSNILAKARRNLVQSATHSWELGTETEALLEFEWSRLSVANPHVFPLPKTLSPEYNASDVISIAERIVSQMPPGSDTLIDGDGAAGDPASLGMAVLLTNWTFPDKKNHTFANAAYKQLQHLLTDVPRSPSGAISHRESQVQLWADFTYMVPPFLAYYGAITHNASLLTEGYQQIKLYREVLADKSGLWKHILLGDSNSTDTTHWGTGNGWAAAGMLRVLQTIQASSMSHHFIKEQADLSAWIMEILISAWPHQGKNGTLFNVIDDPTTFADSTGTAMLASVTYRMASLTGSHALIPFANKAFNLVKNSTDSDGWLTQAVDPLTFDTPLVPGGYTPEGQAFILIMEAAKRDYLTWWARDEEEG